jgi:hypothetical protein
MGIFDGHAQRRQLDPLTATDKEIRDQVGCYSTQWDPRDPTCTTQCAVQARCVMKFATDTLDEVALANHFAQVSEDGRQQVPRPEDMPDADISEQLNGQTPPDAIAYLKALRADRGIGLPVLGPDGQLQPSHKPLVMAPTTPTAPVAPTPVEQAQEAEVQKNGRDLVAEAQAAADAIDPSEDEAEFITVGEPDEASEEEEAAEPAFEEPTTMEAKTEPKKKAAATKPNGHAPEPAKKSAPKKAAPAAKKEETKKPAVQKTATKKAPAKKAAPKSPPPKASTPKKASPVKPPRDSQAWRQERENRHPLIAAIPMGHVLVKEHHGRTYQVTRRKEGWTLGKKVLPTLYAVQVEIAGVTEYPAQEENGKRRKKKRAMASMSAPRFFGLEKLGFKPKRKKAG